MSFTPRFLFSSFVIAAMAALVAIWLGWVVEANADASEGRHQLHMDELITYDGVERIDKADTRQKLISAIIGPDQRYGRTTWYVAWLAANIGEVLSGDQGRIIAVRMTFAGLVLLTAAVFTAAMVQTSFWSFAALSLVLFTPYAEYYATMPKPEPIMLLGLASFVLFGLREGRTRLWAFVFLGVAFGSKISAFPAVVLLSLFAYARASFEHGQNFLKRFELSLIAFALGFFISVPIILTGREGLTTYIDRTWGNRRHGADDAAVGPMQWLEFLHENTIFGVGVVTWVVLAILVLATVWITGPRLLRLVMAPASQKISLFGTFIQSREAKTLLIMSVGIALLASIFVSAQRIWGFYVFPGAVFILMAGAAAGEQLFIERHSHRLKTISVAAVGAAIAISFLGGFGHTRAEFAKAATRSQSTEFQDYQFRHETLTRFATQIATNAGRQVDVIYSARLWHPQATEFARYFPFYGPFNNWKAEKEVLALSAPDVDPTILGRKGTDYDRRVDEAMQLLRAHTTLYDSCTEEICYIYAGEKAPGLHIFVHSDVFGDND